MGKKMRAMHARAECLCSVENSKLCGMCHCKCFYSATYHMTAHLDMPHEFQLTLISFSLILTNKIFPHANLFRTCCLFFFSSFFCILQPALLLCYMKQTTYFHSQGSICPIPFYHISFSIKTLTPVSSQPIMQSQLPTYKILKHIYYHDGRDLTICNSLIYFKSHLKTPLLQDCLQKQTKHQKTLTIVMLTVC